MRHLHIALILFVLGTAVHADPDPEALVVPPPPVASQVVDGQDDSLELGEPMQPILDETHRISIGIGSSHSIAYIQDDPVDDSLELGVPLAAPSSNPNANPIPDQALGSQVDNPVDDSLELGVPLPPEPVAHPNTPTPVQALGSQFTDPTVPLDNLVPVHHDIPDPPPSTKRRRSIIWSDPVFDNPDDAFGDPTAITRGNSNGRANRPQTSNSPGSPGAPPADVINSDSHSGDQTLEIIISDSGVGARGASVVDFMVNGMGVAARGQVRRHP